MTQKEEHLFAFVLTLYTNSVEQTGEPLVLNYYAVPKTAFYSSHEIMGTYRGERPFKFFSGSRGFKYKFMML